MAKNKWLTRLTEDFGILASDMETMQEMEKIQLPSPSFNWATGGGIVEGKSVVFYGPESSGKSLLMLLTFIEVQKKYKDAICILFDAEFSFNRSWFEKLGGDSSRLIVNQTNDPVKIFDFMFEGGQLHEMLEEGAPVKCIGIDSVKSIAYPGDIKEVSTKLTMGGAGAKYLSPTLKRVLPVIRKYKITTCLVQQVTAEMDPMKAMRNPYVITEGFGLKHFADYMIEVTKIDTKAGSIESEVKDLAGRSIQVGHKVRVRCKKVRTGAPYRSAQFTLSYANGIVNTHEEVHELAKMLRVVFHPIGETGRANAQMWQFKDYPAIRGEENMKLWIKDNPDIQKEIIAACTSIGDEQIAEINKKEEPTHLDLDSDE